MYIRQYIGKINIFQKSSSTNFFSLKNCHMNVDATFNDNLIARRRSVWRVTNWKGTQNMPKWGI